MVTKRPAHLGGGRTGIAPAAHRLPRQFWVDQYWPEAGHIGRGLLDTRDWADPDLSPDRRSAQLPRLHVVTDGEVSAHSRRKAFAHAVAATQARSSVRAVAALGSVATVFVTAAATLIWAFLAIPNTPLP
ncbi:MAG: hypothetical protein FWF25_00910 [Propionibacteriaceae bacterium]|nr:hypothetical protein [Propionibacteriaceae bacterium]